MQTYTTEKTRSPFVLLSRRDFVLLWLGQAISQIGDTIFEFTMILWIAAILARHQGWGPLGVSGIMLAQTLPTVLFGPLAGVFIDRWDKRRTLLCMDLLRALLIALFLLITGAVHLPFLPSGFSSPFVQLGSACIMVFLASICAQFFTPARLALTGDLVEEPLRAQAASLEQITGSISLILGPLLAAPLLFGFGIAWALLINIFSFGLSFLSLLLLQAPAAARSGKPGQVKDIGRELGEGLRFTFRQRVVRSLLIGIFIAMLGIGAYNTLYVFFFLQDLHAPAPLLGLLDAIFGFGVIIGAILAGVYAERIGMARLLAFATIGGGLAIIILARLTTALPAGGLLLLIGSCQGALGVTFWPLLLKVTPRELVGRVSAILNPVPTLASMAAVAFSGFLASTLLRNWHATILGLTFGPLDVILMGSGLFIVLAGLYFLQNLRTGKGMRESKDGKELL